MFRETRLITFRAKLRESDRWELSARYGELASSLPGVIYVRTRPSLEGSFNGGDIVSHMVFADEAAWRQARASKLWSGIEEFCEASHIVRCDWAAYRQETTQLRNPSIKNGIHRILLLAVMPEAPGDKIVKFEAEMRDMATYLPAIRNWSFSRVVECGGARPWTHVWEQDFSDPQGLFGPYMTHPIHFAHIDRWFDSQSHDWIVDPELCSTYCAFETSALCLSHEGAA